MFSKLSDKNNTEDGKVGTICLTFKTCVPHEFFPVLDKVYQNSTQEVNKMLLNRTVSSSKYYKSIPCVVAKSLITKYQKNKKIKKVTNLVIPICGDKGKQVKIENNGIRVPSLFKKTVIPAMLPKPIVGHIRHVEFFKRDKKWYMSYSYNTPVSSVEIMDFIGVDRNAVGNVATIALPSEKTIQLGPDASGITKQFRNRRSKLQSKGVKNALKKLRGKQSRRTKDINHKVSRTIVNLAEKHRSAIVLENLGKISKGKAKRFVQKSQWSFYQLETFVKYKAALLGIPVLYIDPRNTSRECYKCGSINIPNGKHYKCSDCGYVAHRDANAALNIRSRGVQGEFNHKKDLSGLIGDPLNRMTCREVKLESSGGVR